MSPITTYETARRRVGAIKGFYVHLTLFILVSVLILASKGTILEVMTEKNLEVDPNFVAWLDWNFLAVILIWGTVILIQWLVVFGRPLIKKWEKRKIETYLRKDRDGIL